jgi:hypothetical protein
MEYVQIVKGTKNHKNKSLKKGISLIFKQGTKQNYVIKKQEHKMCMTNVKTDFYYVNICKCEYENNLIRLWCNIVFKTNVEHNEGNERSYSYLYPVGT